MKQRLLFLIALSLNITVATSYETENIIDNYDDIDFAQNSTFEEYQKERFIFDTNLSSIAEYDSSEDTISIYNTGLDLKLKHKSGLSLNTTAKVNGPVGEIGSKDFKLDSFIKELKANYEFETSRAVVLLSVGKMPTGTKTDQSSPTDIGGVMGVRLSIAPKKIPLIQEWLTKNNLKITKVEITRYDSGSADELDFDNLTETDMTAYALHLSYGRRLHTFFIYKRPDEGSYSPEGITVGGVYQMDAPLKPQFFALNHHSSSPFVELNVLVLSVSVEVISDIRAVVTWSYVVESMTDSEVMITDVGFKKKFEVFGMDFEGKTGVKFERGDTAGIKEKEDIYYMQIQWNFPKNYKWH